MSRSSLSRRMFLTSVATSPLIAATSAQAASDAADDNFQFEVQRSLPEWLARLDAHEFSILRVGGTEVPKSSPLWEETREGQYRCKGCDLPLYSSEYKVVLDIGWVFFQHSFENAVLTGIDFPDQPDSEKPKVQARCRRCGSHLGHIVSIENEVFHCINGTSLNFIAA